MATFAALCASMVRGSRCNGEATPGPPNTLPIDEAPPVFIRQVAHGKLYSVGQGGDQKDLVHLWGTPYENGYALGELLGPKVSAFIQSVYVYVEGQLVPRAANATWCASHGTRCTALRMALKLGLRAALGASFARTRSYLQPYVLDELRGLASATGLPLEDVRDVMWLGELTRGACSMFGAAGRATAASGGGLLQLRALDWDVDGPYKDYAALVVYHPPAGGGHAWLNVGFAGWTAAITGVSSTRLAVSEIGVSFPDETFGPEAYLAQGYPFAFLLRDILQLDGSLADATRRIQSAKRTCDLILGVGDGKVGGGSNVDGTTTGGTTTGGTTAGGAAAGGGFESFSAFQYSPSVARVVKPTTLVPVNDTWHPRIDDVVYYGMDWICPNDNAMLAHQLRAYHGTLTAETTLRHVTSYVRTGDLHVAVYDHEAQDVYVATARPTGADGPLPAYQRQFTRIRLPALFAEPPPEPTAHARA